MKKHLQHTDDTAAAKRLDEGGYVVCNQTSGVLKKKPTRSSHRSDSAYL